MSNSKGALDGRPVGDHAPSRMEGGLTPDAIGEDASPIIRTSYEDNEVDTPDDKI